MSHAYLLSFTNVLRYS